VILDKVLSAMVVQYDDAAITENGFKQLWFHEE
jgi:hypothetical protein